MSRALPRNGRTIRRARRLDLEVSQDEPRIDSYRSTSLHADRIVGPLLYLSVLDEEDTDARPGKRSGRHESIDSSIDHDWPGRQGLQHPELDTCGVQLPIRFQDHFDAND